jgi:molybdate transport system ATP-binding protein
MSLAVDIGHRLGAFSLDARLETDGRLVALFGRSGSGKTSLINVIAGLIRPDKGYVTVDGETLVDTARGIFVPKHRRRIGYVFQEGRLFPHLTVRQNLGYGQWFTPRARRYARLDDIVDLLGIAPLLERRPDTLSGGEKQRVAIGRALLASPRLLLMDEPLAALDEARKSEILPYVERLRDVVRIPIVYVSHAIPEVTRLATTVAVMTDGRIVATGDVADIMARVDLFPLTGRYEAGAVLDTRVVAHEPTYDLTLLESRAGELRVPGIDLPAGTPLRIHIRARDVMLGLVRPEGLSALNILNARIAEIGPTDGPVVDVRLDLNGATLLARVTRLTVDRLELRPGLGVFAVIKSVAFDRRSLGHGRLQARATGPDELTL